MNITSHRRAGLTLMELVVVLAVLVAVTGIVVMILPNMVHRANIASCTATISQLDKAVQTYEGLYSEIPNRMDNLTIGDNLAPYVLAGAGGYGPSFAPATLDPLEITALKNSGLTHVAVLTEKPIPPNDPGDWNPSFWPYGINKGISPGFTTVDASGLKFAVLTNAGARLAGLPTMGDPDGTGGTGNYRYVIFGLNKPCTLFRNTAAEPPYHFADTKAEDPATFYMPFAAIYMVSRDFNDGTTSTKVTLPKAKFVGTIAFHDFGISTVAMHTQEWWTRLKSERPLVGN